MSAAKKAMPLATGWVIERYHFDAPVYWNGEAPGSTVAPWVDAVSNAIHFADKDSADKIISRMCGGFGRAILASSVVK